MFNCSLIQKNWTLSDQPNLKITLVESKGRDMDDMLCNASITVEDEKGEIVEGMETHHLSQEDNEKLMDEFNLFFEDCYDV